MILDKFNVPFIDFVAEHFDITHHQFVFLQAPQYKYGMTEEKDVIWIDKKYKVVELLKYMYRADKIIIHGLWSEHLIKLLFVQPWLLKKCYWILSFSGSVGTLMAPIIEFLPEPISNIIHVISAVAKHWNKDKSNANASNTYDPKTLMINQAKNVEDGEQKPIPSAAVVDLDQDNGSNHDESTQEV